MVFSGPIFDNNPTYNRLKLLFLDFFHGRTVPEIDVEALQYVISISATDATDETPSPKIHFRTYMIKTKRSGHKLPRVEIDEMGPRMDFKIGRIQEPNEELLKQAMQKVKSQDPKTKKNISMDPMGDKMGRIHLGKQDIGKMQTRKMKGLRKRGRDDSGDDSGDGEGDIEMDDDGDDVEMGNSGVPAVSPKRVKI